MTTITTAYLPVRDDAQPLDSWAETDRALLGSQFHQTDAAGDSGSVQVREGGGWRRWTTQRTVDSSMLPSPLGPGTPRLSSDHGIYAWDLLISPLNQAELTDLPDGAVIRVYGPGDCGSCRDDGTDHDRFWRRSGGPRGDGRWLPLDGCTTNAHYDSAWDGEVLGLVTVMHPALDVQARSEDAVGEQDRDALVVGAVPTPAMLAGAPEGTGIKERGSTNEGFFVKTAPNEWHWRQGVDIRGEIGYPDSGLVGDFWRVAYVGSAPGVPLTEAQVTQLAPGTRIGLTANSRHPNGYVKRADGWHFVSTNGHEEVGPHPDSAFRTGDWVVVESFGDPTPPDVTPAVTRDVVSVEQRVEQAKQEVRDCIDEITSDKGGTWGWAALGAYWRLGIEPMPEVDEDVPFWASFGLPNGSWVRYEGQLYEVDGNERQPSHRAGDGADPGYPTDGPLCQVLLLGPWEEPSYAGRNDFLTAVWEWQRRLRSANNWCTEVEHALENAGLDDPGTRIDEEERPPLAAGDDYESVEQADLPRLRALPLGSVVTLGARTFFRISDGDDHEWVETDGDLYRTDYFLGDDLTVQYVRAES